jgi:adhesin/invasin
MMGTLRRIDMSSKKFVYLLMVAIVFGFMTSGAAYGQSTGSLSFKGTVMEADGTPAPGYVISGETVPANPTFTFVGVTSRTDGSYNLTAFSITGAKINVGDQVKITATDAEGNDISVIYTVTAEDIVDNAGNVNLDIVLSGITVTVDPVEIPADGSSTSTVTVMVQEGGTGVTGDTVTISADKGSVGAVTDAGNGTYTATYTAPSLVLIIPDVAQISVDSAATGNSARAAIALVPVPTTVSVSVSPSTFSADTEGTGAVTVTVDRAGPVADETITLGLSPEVGSVSDVTNNGDGTYSATYTSGRAAGNVTLTATATQANKSGTATVVINAGPPVAIEVSAAPETVSSFASAIITAMVTDSNGNGVGGLTPTGTTASGGTLASFAPTRTFGSYTATYTAPMVDAEGTETVTVTADGVSGQVSLTLTPVPPVEVSILDIMGIVCKVDGITPADGVTVTITVGSNAPDTSTTETDGSYTATFFNPLGTVARTGDLVSIVVTDDTGVERGRKDFHLTNDLLGEGGTATFTVPKVMTDIVVPPRFVNVLVVEGVILSDDGQSR